MDYAFPVELEGIQTRKGHPILGRKAVVRTDTGKVLCLVSDSVIRLKTHTSTVEEAEILFMGFGKHETKTFLSKDDTTIKAVAHFKNKVTDFGSGMEVELFLLVEHSYEKTDSRPLVYVGGYVKKTNTWFINPDVAVKLSIDIGPPWSNADSVVSKKWERECDRWLSWCSFKISYDKAKSLIKNGVTGILNRDSAPHVIRRLKPSPEDEVSVWDLYYSIARAICSESYSSFDTKVKKIKELHLYIKKKFTSVKEV